MTLRDLISVSAGNLWRLKLRTTLTMTGVLVAIAAFISMVSFGAGSQQNVNAEYEKLGLFTTIQVYPKKKNTSDTTTAPALDRAALERLASVPGVNLVYPYDAFSVKIAVGDSILTSKAMALPTSAVRTKIFSGLKAGKEFIEDSSQQVIISDDLLRKAGITNFDSMIGRPIVISVGVSTIDSGLVHILADGGETIIDRLKRIHIDSLFNSSYRNRILSAEANEAVRRFLNGFMNAQQIIRDTLTICGVREDGHYRRLRIEPLIIPLTTATRFSSTGFGSSPTELFSAMTSGSFFSRPTDQSGKAFSQVTLDLDPSVYQKTVRDSVEALGFDTFSFAAQFEEIQRFFMYFDLALGVVGLIALFTASLGIVNTMLMSVTERKKEIGILKSLGADEREIRSLFLVESAVIGALGTAAGIFVGWSITRIVSLIAKAYMRSEGVPEMELFALPLWLIGISFAVGIGVSMLAGFYPSARAARVDPVEALRNE